MSAAPKVKDVQASQFEAVAAVDGYVVIDTTSGREYTPEQPEGVARRNASKLNNAIAHSRRSLAHALGALENEDDDPFGFEVHTYSI